MEAPRIPAGQTSFPVAIRTSCRVAVAPITGLTRSATRGTRSMPSLAAMPARAATRSAPVVPSGGDIAPARLLRDGYPTFNGIAIDAERDLVVASDTNLKSVLMYTTRARGSKPLRQIRGEKTEIGFVAGVAVDPDAR